MTSEEEIKGVNNGRKIHQNQLLQFLSWKSLEVEGLFQGNNFSWFYALPSTSALSQCKNRTGIGFALTCGNTGREQDSKHCSACDHHRCVSQSRPYALAKESRTLKEECRR